MDKYDIKSDLMIEAVDLSEKKEGIVSNIKHINNITITDVIVNNENLIKKKKVNILLLNLIILMMRRI